MTGDIGILAAAAYETGIDPITYATDHVIKSHIDVYLIRSLGYGYPLPVSTAALSCRILGDLMDAGWRPPEVTR